MDAPITPADEKIIGRCAWIAMRHLSPGLTRDDLLQEGRLALVLARRAGRVPDEPKHAAAYTNRRVLGAMLSANTAAWQQQPSQVGELTDETHAPEAPGQPEALAQLRQAVARVVSKGSAQLIRCLESLAQTDDCTETAAAMGVSKATVSRMREDARKIASRCW